MDCIGRDLVRKVARGRAGNPFYEIDREAAIQAHRRELSRKGYLDTLEGRFMSEIDNLVPDLMLRNRYRQQILEATP